MTDPKSLEDLSAEVLEKFWGRTALSKPPSAKSIILDALRLARRSGLEMAAEIADSIGDTRAAYKIRARAKELER